jgi:hypothetical protein
MCIALGRESIENQNKLSQADCFAQLVRLLRRHKNSSTKVMLMVIKVLGILCVGEKLFTFLSRQFSTVNVLNTVK